MLRFSLNSEGFDVTVVRTGGEALDLLHRQSQDGVILDLGLPDAKAGAVLDFLREPVGTDGVPPAWLVISAMDAGEAQARYGLKGSRFIPKPFDPWDLMGRLNGLLQRREEGPR